MLFAAVGHVAATVARIAWRHECAGSTHADLQATVSRMEAGLETAAVDGDPVLRKHHASASLRFETNFGPSRCDGLLVQAVGLMMTQATQAPGGKA